jgi:chromosomal replication initiator protein
VETFDYTQAPAVTIIIGEEGLGKTTLLTQLQHKMKNHVPNLIFIDAQKYASKYSFAAYSRELSSFRKFFRSSKLFLFDNINLLKGKTKTIEELFHTLDTILAQEGKIVITYRGNDLCFDFLGERFASRLSSGLVIRLNQPTTQEINNFMEYYLSVINRPNLCEFHLSNKKNMKQVIEFVDKSIQGYSEKETELKGLGANSFDDNINIVLPLVCEYYQAEEKEVFGRSKSIKNVNARYMVFLLLHELFEYSYKDIAQYFKKDLTGMRKRCWKMREEYPELFETLCQKLYNQLD